MHVDADAQIEKTVFTHTSGVLSDPADIGAQILATWIERLPLHKEVLAEVVRPRYGLQHLPLALIVSDFVSQTSMRVYTRHWSEHPLIGQFYLDGDVNLVAAVVLFVSDLCQGGRPDPDMCPQLQRFWHRSTKREVCWRSFRGSM